MAHSRSSILISDETLTRITEYEAAIHSGHGQPAARLAEALKDENNFTTALLRTTLPLISAESSVVFPLDQGAIVATWAGRQGCRMMYAVGDGHSHGMDGK